MGEQLQEESQTSIQSKGPGERVPDSACASASNMHLSRDSSYDSRSLRGSVASTTSDRLRSGAEGNHGSSYNTSFGAPNENVNGSSAGSIPGLPPSIPLTGDPKADADIIAFFKARQ